MKDLFTFVMEAEGDLAEPFDPGMDEQPAPTDQGSMDTAPAGDQDLVGPVPTSDDMGDMPMDSDETMMNGDTGDENNNEDDQKDDTSITEKASNILNQRLYEEFIDRNSKVENILKNIDKLQSVLPYDISHKIQPFITDLKTALFTGQSYVVNDFVDTAYGENRLYYNKLNALYTALLNSIDSNLKKVKTDEDQLLSNYKYYGEYKKSPNLQ